MLRKALLAGVAMVSAVAVLPGVADAKGMQIFHRTGTWASYAGINDEGNPMCMTSTIASADYSNTRVHVKFDSSRPTYLFLHLTKSTWDVPEGKSVRVELQVDNAPGRLYKATGGDHLVQIRIDLDHTDPVTGEPSIQLLYNLLKSGSMLNIFFPDGSERPWRASLNGSGTELAQFANCIRTVKAASDNIRNPTQPFANDDDSKQPATQPFSGGNGR
jgi:hypothetical protein